jgi:hypothetical protein
VLQVVGSDRSCPLEDPYVRPSPEVLRYRTVPLLPYGCSTTVQYGVSFDTLAAAKLQRFHALRRTAVMTQRPSRERGPLAAPAKRPSSTRDDADTVDDRST